MPSNTSKSQIKSYLLDYLKLKFPNIKIVGHKLFECPFSHEHEIKSERPSCNIYPPGSYQLFCFEPSHQKLGNIIDLVRKCEEDKSQWTNEAIEEYLIDLFKIETDDKIEKALINYQLNRFDLVPVEKNGKSPIEKEWTKKNHKSLVEWQDWLASGLNLGCKTGKISNITVIDIDLHGAEFPADIKELAGETLTQKTKNGYHLIFGYEEDIPKTNFDLDDKIHIDVQSDGGQIVIYPSVVDGIGREFNEAPIAKMPKEFKDWLLKYITPTKKEEKGESPDFSDLKLIDLEGCRNNSFLKLGGLLRKKLNAQQTTDVLFLFNSLLPTPLPGKEIMAMSRQLDKYNLTDKNDLKGKVLSHLELVTEASSRDLKDSLGFGKAEIEQVLAELLREELIYKTGRLYRFMQKISWKETFIGESKIIDYEMPFLNHVATIRNSDLIILGGTTSVGKTHFCLNMIKKLVEQGKKPYYLSTEPGNRFTNISIALGLKEADFFWYNHYNPENVELPEQGITFIDWFNAEQACDTHILYKKFAAQLDKKGGNLVVFTQLKEDNSWVAPNLIKYYASVAAKIRHPNKQDRSNGVIETDKVRESKSRQQYISIPFTYDFETKRVELKSNA